jgi:hypothetical protein
MLTEARSFREKRWNCHAFIDSRCEMLLMTIGQLLSTAKRVKVIGWDMPKGDWIASGQFSTCRGKLLGNAQIPSVSQYERRQNCPATISKNVAIPLIFSEAQHFCLYSSKLK